MGLINDLLDISKIEARTVELEHIPFSLTQVVQEIISIMALRAQEKDLQFMLDAKAVAGKTFLGDPTRLRQILLNLCSNAMKFTDAGAIKVTISATPRERGDVETIGIAVQDNGIGIAPEKLETIFEKFVRADSSIDRKYGGSGLGLAITKTLTQLMGGEISVQSEVGTGTTFNVSLPLEISEREEQPAADDTLAPLARAVRGGPTVLIVEDFEPNVVVPRYFVVSFGYNVVLAANGREAVDRVRKGGIDAILMDIQMHEMNGLDATKAIREYERLSGLRAVPIIGVTAHALSGDRERCIAAGMNDYLSKPFNPDILQASLAAQIEQASH